MGGVGLDCLQWYLISGMCYLAKTHMGMDSYCKQNISDDITRLGYWNQ